MIPRVEQGTRDGREGMVTRIATGAGAGSRTGTEMGMRPGLGTRVGAGKGMRMEMRVKGTESLGNFDVVIEVGRKT